MAPNFTKGGPIESLKGFEGIEVWQIDKDDYSEDMYVNSWWKLKKILKIKVIVMYLNKHIKILENPKIHQSLKAKLLNQMFYLL